MRVRGVEGVKGERLKKVGKGGKRRAKGLVGGIKDWSSSI